MFSSFQAVLNHRLSVLDNRHLLLIVLETAVFTIKVLTDSVSSEDPQCLADGHFLTASSDIKDNCDDSSFSYKDTNSMVKVLPS